MKQGSSKGKRPHLALVVDHQDAAKNAAIQEISSIMSAAKMVEAVKAADYVRGAEEVSLDGDLMQVKSGLRALGAMICHGGEQIEWLSMVELLADKIDAITERLTIGVRHVRNA